MHKIVIINNYKGPCEWVNGFNFPFIVYTKYNPRIPEEFWKFDYENIYQYYDRLFSTPNYLEIMKPIESDNPFIVTNVGHETSTFFGHIVKNYDNVADINIFLHNSPFHHCHGFDIIQVLNDLNELDDFIDFGTMMTSNVNGGPTDECPVGKIYNQLFPNKPVPEIYDFASGSLFAISKETIYRMGKPFFEQCVRISEIEPRAPWAFERLFRTLFKKEN